jgi:ABC-type antimicrobial peptide transport system ATPase subunit
MKSEIIITEGQVRGLVAERDELKNMLQEAKSVIKQLVEKESSTTLKSDVWQKAVEWFKKHAAYFKGE